MAEQYRKHVYCEKRFLEHCISTIAEWKLCEENFEELRLWMCIKTLIFSQDIILHLDITDDDLPRFNGMKPKRDYTDWEKELAQKQNNQKIHLKLGNFVTPDNIDKSNKEQLTAYYLTCCDSAICQKCMEEYGVLAICPENIKDFKAILYDNGTAIGKNEYTNWQNSLKYSPRYCNSLVLVDNYILTDNKLCEENLTDIFEVLLPKKLNTDVPFQISIFSTFKDVCDSRKLWESIALNIERLRPELLFKLSIFKVSTDKFHDRTLVTNNIYVNCGGGFDLIKNGKSSKNTTLNCVFPFLCKSSKWDPVAYSNFINEVSKVYHNSSDFKAEYLKGFYIGDKQNRLIE